MIYDDDGTAEGAGVPYGGDQPRDTKAVARRYKAIIARYDKAFDRWQTKAKKIIQIYLEERSDTDRVAQNRKMSLLWPTCKRCSRLFMRECRTRLSAGSSATTTAWRALRLKCWNAALSAIWTR